MNGLKLHPTILQTKPHENVSEKYRFVSTLEVLNDLAEHGWQAAKQQISRTRSSDKEGYQAHLIRLRNDEFTNLLGLTDEYPEVVLRNEHAGGRSLLLMCGIFRLVCSNGLIIGNSWSSFRIPHIGYARERLDEAIAYLVGAIPHIFERVRVFKTVELKIEEQRAFAESALVLKHGEGYVVDRDALIASRRVEDREPTLWNTFNIVQERLVNGKYRARQKTEDRYKAKKRPAITSIDSDVRLNRSLWMLAERMAELKGVSSMR